MKRGTLDWYRYRMISGVVLAGLGIVIGIRLAMTPGPLQSKLLGGVFVPITIALGVVRVIEFTRARASLRNRR